MKVYFNSSNLYNNSSRSFGNNDSESNQNNKYQVNNANISFGLKGGSNLTKKIILPVALLVFLIPNLSFGLIKNCGKHADSYDKLDQAFSRLKATLTRNEKVFQEFKAQLWEYVLRSSELKVKR